MQYGYFVDEFSTAYGDTIRDAILTCAHKLTRVGLIYRTETTAPVGFLVGYLLYSETVDSEL